MAAALTRWRKPISVLSAVWFVVTIAAHARFITLPKIELLTGTAATVAAALWNGIWWGYLRPQIERRRATLANTELNNG
jgi:hypothetical protein